MLGYTPPRPQFWKALMATAIPIAFVTWSVQFFHMRIPQNVLVVLAIGAWFAIAYTINSRVSNDWRAQYELNVLEVEHERAVTPSVQIKDE